MAKEILDIINRIALEKNIPVENLYDALESALITASKKMLNRDVDVVEAELDRETGDFRVYANMEVVEEVMDEFTEISLEEAQDYVEDVELGEILVIDVTPDGFGRIAAQSAKQVITQRIREAEREVIFDKYKNRAGDLIAGTVQRYEKGNVIVDLGNAEAVMPKREVPPGERHRYGERVKAVILDIRKTTKDAQIVLSRATPLLVSKLFEQEVTEIQDGVVSIRFVAREPGKRSKIAVLSSDNDVDPVGACVGMKGSRVQMVVQELRGERIDIIEYSSDKRRFVANSLKPATIESVELNHDNSSALLVVRDDELALAIGKGGVNVQLASELTGVHIDIISESQLVEREAQAKRELLRLPSMTDSWSEALLAKGIITLDDLGQLNIENLLKLDGMTEEKAKLIFQEVEQFIDADENEEEQDSVPAQAEEKPEAASMDDEALNVAAQEPLETAADEAESAAEEREPDTTVASAAEDEEDDTTKTVDESVPEESGENPEEKPAIINQ